MVVANALECLGDSTSCCQECWKQKYWPSSEKKRRGQAPSGIISIMDQKCIRVIGGPIVITSNREFVSKMSLGKCRWLSCHHATDSTHKNRSTIVSDTHNGTSGSH